MNNVLTGFVGPQSELNQHDQGVATTEVVRELLDTELSMIGGGSGDVVLG